MNNYTLENFLDIKTAGGGSFNKDDNKIAYLSDVTGTSQVFIKDLVKDTVEQITDYPDGIRFASYIPHHDQILFGKDIGGNEQTQFYIYDESTKQTKKITSDDASIYRPGGISKDGKKIAYSSNQRNGKDFDVYVLDLDTLKETCVYQDHGWCDSSGFSPDGKKLVILDRASLTANSLVLVDIETKKSKILNKDQTTKHSQARWLPDNSGFFFISNENSDFLAVDFYHLGSAETHRKLAFNWDVSELSVSKDGKSLAITVNENGYETIKLYDVLTFTQIDCKGFPQGMASGLSWSSDSSMLLFSYGDSTQTKAVWLWEKSTDRSRQISPDFQPIESSKLVNPELITFTSHDGMDIPSFLYLPKDTDGRENLPVIIFIHGGPESQYTPSFNPLVQYFLYKGYAVAAPNVRGSSGYGKHYLTLDDKEKRLDSVQDIVYLKKYLETRPEINSQKVILMGGSYGGYMVLANMAFYPEHWLAGIDIVGIANFVSFLENTSEWRRELREVEYGSLTTDKEMLERISPINKVENIQAPLFIIHGANDPRVPLSEAEQIDTKLKELGRDVELHVYQDEGHGLAKLKNKVDAYSKVLAFLERYV